MYRTLRPTSEALQHDLAPRPAALEEGVCLTQVRRVDGRQCARRGGADAALVDKLRDLAEDPGLRASLVEHGLQTIQARHTCAHRAAELLAVAERVRG